MKRKYENEIRKFYGSELIKSFELNTNENYNNALKMKYREQFIWQKIVRFYKDLGYARDVTNVSHLQTNTLIVGSNGIIEGVIINISFLPQYISFYFYHQYEKSKIPIIDKYGKENVQLCYYPFNKKQELFCKEVLDRINTHFPTFEIFNNLFANEEIENVIIDNLIVKKSNFFHVIFEDNMFTIF